MFWDWQNKEFLCMGNDVIKSQRDNGATVT